MPPAERLAWAYLRDISVVRRVMGVEGASGEVCPHTLSRSKCSRWAKKQALKATNLHQQNNPVLFGGRKDCKRPFSEFLTNQNVFLALTPSNIAVNRRHRMRPFISRSRSSFFSITLRAARSVALEPVCWNAETLEPRSPSE